MSSNGLNMLIGKEGVNAKFAREFLFLYPRFDYIDKNLEKDRRASRSQSSKNVIQ